MKRKQDEATTATPTANAALDAMVSMPSANTAPPDLLPITVLSGFLGAGKTTLLRHMLQNSDGLKICCIVNDVASINIDSKLVKNHDKAGESKTVESSSSSSSAGATVEVSGLREAVETVELQNGCVCCSSSDELATAVFKLASKPEADKFDHIIVESTGVAEPRGLRDMFFQLEEQEHELMELVYLRCMVTVVDSQDFLGKYYSKQNIQDRPDLGQNTYALDRKVVDLLTEQVECADIIVCNKSDKVAAKDLDYLEKIMRTLNPAAKVMSSTFGKVEVTSVLNKKPCMMACWNTQNEVKATLEQAQKHKRAKTVRHSHDSKEVNGKAHDHSHASDEKNNGHNDHSQDHSHGHSHGHSHSHGQSHDSSGGEHPHEKDESKDHSHANSCTHDHVHTEECKGHGAHEGHSHSHKHKDRFGISSFAFTERRPFDAQRLNGVLAGLDVMSNSHTEERDETSPLRRVIRSKGFVWINHFHNEMFYWSHAGAHVQLVSAGPWWATLEDVHEIEDNVKQDFQEPYGDRRQEVVFIGIDMDEAAIRKKLEAALLTPEEFENYKQAYKGSRFQ